MKGTLISWIGGNDLSASKHDQLGPVISTLKKHSFTRVVLLYNYPKKDVAPYLSHLSHDYSIEAHYINLTSPIDFGEIHHVANQHLEQISKQGDEVSILLSPGTPAMQAVWILLAKTKYPATFFQSTVEQGVQQVEIPFSIAAEFQPGIKQVKNDDFSRVAIAEVPINAAFDDIITNNPVMQQLKARATSLAEYDVPVLIQGESGTGKELFATALHNSSSRAGSPFIAVNCGALPQELIDSLLFGHTKGAFTGAADNKDGFFKQADGGTIFLDEFGELSKDAQVRLLRVLQSGELTPVGAAKPIKVNVRVVAATNKDLIQEVANNNFREDLFYRIAVGVLNLPPLREREGDISVLSDALLGHIVKSLNSSITKNKKKFSVDAKKLLISSAWPGNIRELHSTILRACLWSGDIEISESDLKAAMLKMPSQSLGLLDHEFNEAFDIQGLIDDLVRSYIKKAMSESGGNQTRAAELLGLSSYQTLKNWIKKHKVT